MIITGPGDRIFLTAGIAGPRNYKRTHITMTTPATEGGFYHIMTIGVVHLSMSRNALFVGKNQVIGQRAVEACRFVHIGPNAGDAEVDQVFLLVGPPVTNRGLAEIREDRIAGPDFVDIDIAVGGRREIATSHALLVNIITRLDFYTGIDNGHRLEAVGTQVGDHLLFIVKKLLIPGEDFESIHIIDVEMNAVAGDAVLA